MAASTEPATHVNTATRSTEMPSSRADSPFSAAARTATPKRVTRKKMAAAAAMRGTSKKACTSPPVTPRSPITKLVRSTVGMIRTCSAWSALRLNRRVTMPRVPWAMAMLATRVTRRGARRSFRKRVRSRLHPLRPTRMRARTAATAKRGRLPAAKGRNRASTVSHQHTKAPSSPKKGWARFRMRVPL